MDVLKLILLSIVIAGIFGSILYFLLNLFIDKRVEEYYEKQEAEKNYQEIKED